MMNVIAKLPSAGSFRRKAITNCIESVQPTNPKTLRKVLKSLIRCEEDAMRAFSSGGLVKLSDAYLSLSSALNDTNSIQGVTAVVTELDELLSIVELILKTLCDFIIRGTFPKEQLSCWKESRNQFTETITHTLNSHVCPNHKQLTLQILDITIKLYPHEVASLLLPLLSRKHNEFYKLHNKRAYLVGPHFPRIRPNQDTLIPNPDVKAIQQFNMFINDTQIPADFGVDHLYDQALTEFYKPYHEIVRSICEEALSHGLHYKEMIRLACLTAREGLRLRLSVVPKFILSVGSLPQQGDVRIIDLFYESSFFVELIETMVFSYNCVLQKEFFHKFCFIFYPKVKNDISADLWSSFFLTTSGEFSKLDSDPNLHMKTMKTLELYLKTNPKDKMPSYLTEILCIYCGKHLNEEIESHHSQDTITMEQLESPHAQIGSDSEEQNIGERKRPTPQLSDPTKPKRSKLDASPSNIDPSQECEQSQTPSQSSKSLNITEANPGIEMLKLLHDLLTK